VGVEPKQLPKTFLALSLWDIRNPLKTHAPTCISWFHTHVLISNQVGHQGERERERGRCKILEM
jgi:hypothetical protein